MVRFLILVRFSLPFTRTLVFGFGWFGAAGLVGFCFGRVVFPSDLVGLLSFVLVGYLTFVDFCFGCGLLLVFACLIWFSWVGII